MKLWSLALVSSFASLPTTTAAADPTPVRITVSASSEVPKYAAWNALIGAGWCTDQGAGQSLQFDFEPSIEISKVELHTGNATFAKNPDPTAVTVTVGDFVAKPALVDGAFEVKPGDILVSQAIIEVDAIAKIKGKSKLSCLRSVVFRAADGSMYLPLVGIDQAAQDGLRAFALKADAALKACDAAALAEVAGFPFVQTHTTYKDIDYNSVPVEKVTKVKDVKALVKACKKRGSFLAKGWGSDDRAGDDLDKSLAGMQSSGLGVVTLGNEAHFVVKWAADHWTLVGVGTVKSPE